MEKERNKHYGVVFNRKSGKIVTTLEHDYSDTFLRMYAMGNLTKANDYVVFSATTGKITGYFEGKGKNDFPNVHEDMIGKNVNEICNGLLEALNAE